MAAVKDVPIGGVYENPDEGYQRVGPAEPIQRTVTDIVELYRELKGFYGTWKAQQTNDDRFYNLLYDVAMTDNPKNFEAVRPPTATTIIDMAADHSAGNFPRLHIPKRTESADADRKAQIMMKAGQGFWYRTIASLPRNILRDWALSGALRGAMCGSIQFNRDAWADLPLPSDFRGGIRSKEYQDEYDEIMAQRQSAWPFVLRAIDPLDVYPDPASEGRDFIIHAFERRAYEIKRAWPQWDWTVPGTKNQVKSTDWVTFIAFADEKYKAYVIAGKGMKSGGKPLLPDEGVIEHGQGFNPFMFMGGGFGSPFGRPEYRYRGLITNVRDLLGLEARRMTHLDAIVAQQAFPWLVIRDGIQPNFELGGVTRVPAEVEDVRKAIYEMRPQVPIQEIVLELDTNRAAIQRATIPDALGGTRPRGVDSGYHESILVGTGRARIRALSDSLERMVEWGTTGFFKLVENKAKQPVSVWGKGMPNEDEFVTIKPKDINGHYEVYASLTPSLPQDDSMNIANGLKLYGAGLIPGEDMLQTYAARENAHDLLVQRLGEDVLHSQPAMEQLISDALRVTSVTGGEIVQPGVRGPVQLGGGPVAAASTALPQRGPAGIGGPATKPGGIPTPHPAPGSLEETQNIIGRNGNAGAPSGAAPLSGISRGGPGAARGGT